MNDENENVLTALNVSTGTRMFTEKRKKQKRQTKISGKCIDVKFIPTDAINIGFQQK